MHERSRLAGRGRRTHWSGGRRRGCGSSCGSRSGGGGGGGDGGGGGGDGRGVLVAVGAEDGSELGCCHQERGGRGESLLRGCAGRFAVRSHGFRTCNRYNEKIRRFDLSIRWWGRGTVFVHTCPHAPLRTAPSASASRSAAVLRALGSRAEQTPVRCRPACLTPLPVISAPLTRSRSPPPRSLVPAHAIPGLLPRTHALFSLSLNKARAPGLPVPALRICASRDRVAACRVAAWASEGRRARSHVVLSS